MIRDVIGGGRMPERYDVHLRRPDGSVVISEVQVTLVAGGLLGVGRDVTEVRALQAELSELALRDPLTGLANRRLLDEVLTLALGRTARSGVPLAVAMIDLDRFKAVNDTHGHEAGDAVLVETARRLSTTVREADVVARTGGDEFVIVHEAGGADTDHFVTRLHDALARPIDLGNGVSVRCPASIGVVDTDAVGRDPRVAVRGRRRGDVHRQARRTFLVGLTAIPSLPSPAPAPHVGVIVVTVHRHRFCRAAAAGMPWARSDPAGRGARRTKDPRMPRTTTTARATAPSPTSLPDRSSRSGSTAEGARGPLRRHRAARSRPTAWWSAPASPDSPPPPTGRAGCRRRRDRRPRSPTGQPAQLGEGVGAAGPDRPVDRVDPDRATALAYLEANRHGFDWLDQHAATARDVDCAWESRPR